MADKKELDRVNQVASLIDRYYQFEDAVDVNKQNIEYLKTYIHDGDYVEQNFDMKSKFLRDIAISAGVAVVVFAICLIFTSLIISAIVGVVACVVCIIVFSSIAKARLNAKKQEQVEINTGITEQIQALELVKGTLGTEYVAEKELLLFGDGDKTAEILERIKSEEMAMFMQNEPTEEAEQQPKEEE